MRRSRVLLSPLLLALTASSLSAQNRPRASQHGTVSQTVRQTVVTVEYDRPVARGRALFGNLVRWDEPWTPGANRTTWLDVSTDVTFEGQALAAGRYGIWLVPAEQGPWEWVLVTEWDTNHGAFAAESEVLRARVVPEDGAHMETLAFYFPVVGPDDAMLHLHWGTTILPVRIEVPQ